MSVDVKPDIEDDDEAWLLFLKKFENLQLPPEPKIYKDENVIYGIFNKSIGPLRKST